MEEKQKLIILSGIKAAATTALLFGAAIKIAEINTLPTLFRLCTTLSVCAISWIGMWFYLTTLIKKGVLDTKQDYLKSFIQTFAINRDENAGILTISWIKSFVVCAALFINILLMIVLTYSMVIPLIGGFVFTYMARKENKPVRYFIMGYSTGAGSLLCGLLIAYLTTIFGPILVWSFILTDATITGIYTYLDLKEWEHEQNKKIQEAKIKAGLA